MQQLKSYERPKSPNSQTEKIGRLTPQSFIQKIKSRAAKTVTLPYSNGQEI
jgi:hypothetical protein